MPVRSLRSSVLVWPNLPQVDGAARAWADRQAAAREGVAAIGYFGSYARRDHGPGSDLDLVAIVSTSARPFIERACEWDLRGIPVPADLLVYTRDEWRRLQAEAGRFARTLAAETVWMIGSLEG
jgi:uncharacterized protein